ncbi:MAG: methyltransferase domain-containing protein [Planctomycetaceae bacterium]|nr:methyltransferase domain-containing protein [Planctomycetaceae bacterium]
MIPRILEPEVMDTAAEACEYDAMDHAEVNRVFVDDLLAAIPLWDPVVGRVLDVGTGTAQIPLELCGRSRFAGEVVGVDLAEEMLILARQNISRAGWQTRVQVECIDAKSLRYADSEFDIVMSNSIVHHIPQPLDVLREMVRVVRPGGQLFVRDLLRPVSDDEVEQIVTAYAGQEPVHAQQLFRQSLWAALTVDEMRALTTAVGLPIDCVRQTSDRHWTLAWTRQT